MGWGLLVLRALKSSRGETFVTLHQRTAALSRVTLPGAAAQLFPEQLHLCHWDMGNREQSFCKSTEHFWPGS